MRVDDPLGVAGGSGRVHHRAGPVLLHPGPVHGRCRAQEVLVVMDLLPNGVRIRSGGAVVHEHHVADSLEAAHQGPDQAGHRVVQEDHLVLGMVHDVAELLGEQSQVEGVGDPAGAWRGEVELQVAGGVPREGGHPTVLADAQVVQDAAESAGPLTPFGVADPFAPGRGGGHHLLVGEQAGGAVEDVDQRQRCVHHQAIHQDRSSRWCWVRWCWVRWCWGSGCPQVVWATAVSARDTSSALSSGVSTSKSAALARSVADSTASRVASSCGPADRS